MPQMLVPPAPVSNEYVVQRTLPFGPYLFWTQLIRRQV